MESQDFSLGFNINRSDDVRDNNSFSYEEVDRNNDIIEFKIILIGSVSVGKTSIFNKFISGEFNLKYKSTITAECKSKYLKVNKNLFAKLNIWDTCGSEIYRAVTKQYYRGSNGAILIFDLTDQNTFNDLKKWIKDIKNYGEKNTQVIVVGNKLDLVGRRKVSHSQATNFCRENNYKYYIIYFNNILFFLYLVRHYQLELPKFLPYIFYLFLFLFVFGDYLPNQKLILQIFLIN